MTPKKPVQNVESKIWSILWRSWYKLRPSHPLSATFLSSRLEEDVLYLSIYLAWTFIFSGKPLTRNLLTLVGKSLWMNENCVNIAKKFVFETSLEMCIEAVIAQMLNLIRLPKNLARILSKIWPILLRRRFTHKFFGKSLYKKIVRKLHSWKPTFISGSSRIVLSGNDSTDAGDLVRMV